MVKWVYVGEVWKRESLTLLQTGGVYYIEEYISYIKSMPRILNDMDVEVA